MLRGIFYAIISGAQSAPRLQIKNGADEAAPFAQFMYCCNCSIYVLL